MEYVHGGDIYTYEGMLDFSANINPFGPSEGVMKAVRESALQIGAYPDSRCRGLKKALAEMEKIPEDSLIFGNGAAELIFLLAMAKRPQKALLTAPSFLEYAQALKACSCEIQYYPLRVDLDFALDEGYLEKLTEDVDMAFLCTPDNPTGQNIKRSLLQKIISRCRKHHILLVLDQCFYEFLENQEEVLTPPEVIEEPSIFLLRAFTKMHAMPGLRLGYGISGDAKLLESLAYVRQPWSVSVTAQAAGLAALRDEKRVEETRAFISKERGRLEQELKRTGVEYVPSSANYILLKSELPLFELLKRKQILIRDCGNYKGLAAGYYRIAIRTSAENDRLLEALEEIMKEYQKEE